MSPILSVLFLFLGGLLLLLAALRTGRRLIAHCVRVLLNSKSPIRWFAGLVAGIFPPVAWTVCFKLARNLPDSWRPPIHILILPILEHALLSPAGVCGLTVLLVVPAYLLRTQMTTTNGRITYPLMIVFFPVWLKTMNVLALNIPWTPFQDVLAWIFYGVLHFASPFLAGWWIWGFGSPGAATVYGFTLGLQNLCGLLTHLLFPNAAPWYYDIYKSDVIPTYDFPGNPAGLIRVDQALGTHLYNAAFKKSPVVFGALPSLHAASATCFSFFVARYGGKWGHVIMFIYTTMMFWSTQYLHHHFAVDLIFGTLYSLVAFSIACIFLRRLDIQHEKLGTTRGVDRLFCRQVRGAAAVGIKAELGDDLDEEKQGLLRGQRFDSVSSTTSSSSSSSSSSHSPSKSSSDDESGSYAEKSAI